MSNCLSISFMAVEISVFLLFTLTFILLLLLNIRSQSLAYMSIYINIYDIMLHGSGHIAQSLKSRYCPQRDRHYSRPKTHTHSTLATLTTLQLNVYLQYLCTNYKTIALWPKPSRSTDSIMSLIITITIRRILRVARRGGHNKTKSHLILLLLSL